MRAGFTYGMKCGGEAGLARTILMTLKGPLPNGLLWIPRKMMAWLLKKY
jgi:hypothetical protein